MAWPETLWYLLLTAAGIVTASAILHLSWRLHGQWKIHRAGPRLLSASRHRLWRPPTPADARRRRRPAFWPWRPGRRAHAPFPVRAGAPYRLPAMRGGGGCARPAVACEVGARSQAGVICGEARVGLRLLR